MSFLQTLMGMVIKTYMEVMGTENSIVVQSGMTTSNLVIFSKDIFSHEETIVFWGTEYNYDHGNKIIRCGVLYCAQGKIVLLGAYQLVFFSDFMFDRFYGEG